ncbi:endonuclease domain-containing protein [Azospirillum thermophilum]|nr:endonuclease domain-containing protein [Azospirillum thermophilum]
MWRRTPPGPAVPAQGIPGPARQADRGPADPDAGRAGTVRRTTADAEKIVWQKLRNGQLGARFRRQEPILGFVADFVSHDHRLIVELDGGRPAEQRAGQDERRTRVLEQAGFRVLRFWNTDIIDNLDGVLETIKARLTETAVLRSQPSGKDVL